MIDLRSDTVTKPGAAMRAVMAAAEVGDDVYGEDPTVRALEEEVAALCGKAAALFVPSGTMGNQLAVAAQTRPGDEVVVSDGAHVAFYESGASAALSGVQLVAVGSAGVFSEADVDEAVKPRAYWCPQTTLVCVENTHNRAGGRVFPSAMLEGVAAAARRHGLSLHVDGARIWNAAIASRRAVAELLAPATTASVCFSKGLGAPVGSALVGERTLVERARTLRKRWGGGMRQAGLLAAAALHALRHHRERLADDHDHARRFAAIVADSPHLAVDVASVETNIVHVSIRGSAGAEDVAARALANGVRVAVLDRGRLRAVFHHDVSRSDADRAARALVMAAGGGA